MAFEEILDRALDMLRRRGRVTYGALKRQFGLDDAYLADLKDALLYADSRVVDDAGRGLRWTGAPLSTVQRAFAGVARFYGEAGVLWLVRALLQHEGRVSYRTLRKVLGFDEARLAEVRAELLFTQCAVDEAGQGSSGRSGRPRIVPWARPPLPAFRPPPRARQRLPQRPPVALRKPNAGS
jgi:hypothetical protein